MPPMMAAAPPLPDGLHVWLTEEMGFAYDPRTRWYRHPTRVARISVDRLQRALAQGTCVQVIQGWVANHVFQHPAPDADDG